MFCSILFHANSKAQNFEWAKGFGEFSDDFVRIICVDSLGNIYLAGSYDEDVDVDPGPGETILINIDAYDVYLLKFSPEGEFLWAKTFAGMDYQDVNDIVIDKSGRLLIAGEFTGTTDLDPGPGEMIVTGDGSYYTTFFVCLNLDGELLWQFTDSDHGSVATAINLDKDENIYLSGSLTNDIDMDPGPGVFMLEAEGDIYIRKLDHEGNFLWAKKFEDDDINGIYDLAVDDDDNIYFTGSFSGTLDFDPGPLEYDYTSAGGNDVYLIKWDAEGTIIWYTTFGGPEDEYPRTIQLGTDGNIYTAGRFEGSCDFDGSLGTAIGVSGGNSDAYVCKYDSDGNYIWSWAFGSTGFEFWNTFVMDSLDNLYVGGEFFGAVDFDPGPGELISNAGSDYGGYVVKLNKDKTLIWAMTINTGWGASVHDLCRDKNDNVFYAGGFSGEADFDPGPAEYFLPYAGGYPYYKPDVYVAKLNQDMCANFAIVTDSIADITCLADGYGAVHAVDGAAPYTFSWDLVLPVEDSITSFTEKGIYSVTATDTNACLRKTTYYIDGPGSSLTDWQASIVTEDIKYGFESYIWLDAFNNGCESVSGTLQLILDPGFTYEEAFPIPDNISGDTLSWVMNDFVFGTPPLTPQILITDTGADIGEVVRIGIRIISAAEDIDTTNNNYDIYLPVIGAIDPNDKTVYPPGACNAGYILNDQILTYKIRFQNTGTAPAVNIEIIDSLSQWLDVSTIDVVSTSHYMYTEIEGDSVVKFIFPDIYLPDSTADESASHGYVVFSMRPLPGLDDETVIENNSGIYFDFNAPVITNIVSNTVVDEIPVYNYPEDVALCAGDSLVVGEHVYLTPGTYIDHFFNVEGCDSTIITTLTVNPVYDETIFAEICSGESYLFGATEITSPGVYNETFTSVLGCDSVVELTLEENTIDISVTVSENELTANLSDATYQWIDCDNNSIIIGETEQSFIPAISGNYAVIVSDGLCAYTSSCSDFIFQEIDMQQIANYISIEPNPATDHFSIDIDQQVNITACVIKNMSGQIIMTIPENIITGKQIDIADLQPAMYMIELKTNHGIMTMPLIKL
ncbi:MAG: T9SS type A sorting domain-containing protein [Chitinophagales bacterium]|nr:T9SS type A sorting domain-containing protein [Chitinophagales bacterium]